MRHVVVFICIEMQLQIVLCGSYDFCNKGFAIKPKLYIYMYVCICIHFGCWVRVWMNTVNGQIMQIKLLTKVRCNSATHFIHKLSDCIR
jgi:hypothetical protein